MAKPKRLYWDSCAWIGLLNGEPDKKRELEIVYGAARKGRFELWTSTISLVECRRLESERNQPKPLDQENDKRIADLFRQPFVKPIPMAVDIAEQSRELLRGTVGLTKMADGVHLASALRWSVHVMHTYDNDDLLHLSEKFRCKDGTLLVIEYPDTTTDGPLFGNAKRQK